MNKHLLKGYSPVLPAIAIPDFLYTKQPFFSFAEHYCSYYEKTIDTLLPGQDNSLSLEDLIVAYLQVYFPETYQKWVAFKDEVAAME